MSKIWQSAKRHSRLAQGTHVSQQAEARQQAEANRKTEQDERFRKAAELLYSGGFLGEVVEFLLVVAVVALFLISAILWPAVFPLLRMILGRR
jgi:hypothetical protein